MAVSVHGYPRLTRDIVVLIRQDDLEEARRALGAVGYTLDSGMIAFDSGKASEGRLHRVAKTEGTDFLTLDLILVNAFLEDVWRGRERHRLGDRDLQVVSRSGLTKMKRAAGRPQDLADLAGLEDAGGS